MRGCSDAILNATQRIPLLSRFFSRFSCFGYPVHWMENLLWFTVDCTGYVICPAKSEWQITLVGTNLASLVSDSSGYFFFKYYFMNLFKIWFLTYLHLKNAQRHHQYRSKNQNVICHMQMLSAIAQPQPLCYLPHLCWDRIPQSNNNSPCFKRMEIQLITCLENF
jgi:hypothetical protein